jgi:TonB-dependent SusC/RagA subfamily outer membrane receptor
MKTPLISVALLLLTACAADRLTSVEMQATPEYQAPTASAPPLIYVDGKESTVAAMQLMRGDAIQSIEVVKGKAAVSRYGARGTRGVILIVTKAGVP